MSAEPDEPPATAPTSTPTTPFMEGARALLVPQAYDGTDKPQRTLLMGEIEKRYPLAYEALVASLWIIFRNSLETTPRPFKAVSEALRHSLFSEANYNKDIDDEDIDDEDENKAPKKDRKKAFHDLCYRIIYDRLSNQTSAHEASDFSAEIFARAYTASFIKQRIESWLQDMIEVDYNKLAKNSSYGARVDYFKDDSERDYTITFDGNYSYSDDKEMGGFYLSSRSTEVATEGVTPSRKSGSHGSKLHLPHLNAPTPLRDDSYANDHQRIDPARHLGYPSEWATEYLEKTSPPEFHLHLIWAYGLRDRKQVPHKDDTRSPLNIFTNERFQELCDRKHDALNVLGYGEKPIKSFTDWVFATHLQDEKQRNRADFSILLSCLQRLIQERMLNQTPCPIPADWLTYLQLKPTPPPISK